MGLGKKTAFFLGSLSSYTGFITAAKAILDLYGRGDILARMVSARLFWLILPFVSIVAIVIAFWILLRETREGPPQGSRLVDEHGNPITTPVRRVKRFGASVALGGLLAALTVGIMWLAFQRSELRVTVTTEHPGRIVLGEDEVRIYLTAITETTETPSITGSIQSDGRWEMKILDAKPGHIYNYPDEHGYRIKFSEVTPDRKAIFLVSKNP